MKTDVAVSEIVGALILVALVITGIGIIAVIMFSVPPPESKEKVVLSSSCMQCDTDSFVILNRHEGGDVINPQKMKFYLTTEYANHTVMNRFQVYATSFLPAEVFSGMDKTGICDPLVIQAYPYTINSKTMRNGDVIVIWYEMDENSKI